MVLQGTSTKAWAGTHSNFSSKLMPGVLEEPVFLESSWAGKLVELWASQLQGKPALISHPSCIPRETAKHKRQRTKKESSNYSQTTRTMFKSKDAVMAAERKICPKQLTEEIVLFYSAATEARQRRNLLYGSFCHNSTQAWFTVSSVFQQDQK